MNLLEIEKLNPASIKLMHALNLLIEAFDNWPKTYDTAEQYISEIEIFIGGAANKYNIKRCLSTIDLNKYAWQSESLSILIELYNYCDDMLTLSQIVEDIYYDSKI